MTVMSGLTWHLYRCDLFAYIGDLALDTRAQLGKSQTKFAMTTPLHRGFLHGEGISFLRINPALECGAKRHSDRTRDAAAPGREVSELALTTNDLTL